MVKTSVEHLPRFHFWLVKDWIGIGSDLWTGLELESIFFFEKPDLEPDLSLDFHLFVELELELIFLKRKTKMKSSDNWRLTSS